MFNAPFKKVNDTLHLNGTCKGGDDAVSANADQNLIRSSDVVSLPANTDDAESEYSFKVSDQLLGFLRLDCNIVEGWLAERTAEPFTRKLVATVSGASSEFTIREVDAPVGPYLSQPPSNAIFFQVDVSSVMRGKRGRDYLKIQISERPSEDGNSKDLRTLLSLSASRRENIPLNKNPCMYSESTVSIPEWEIPVSDEIGLRVDEFSQNKPFSTYSQFDPCMQGCDSSRRPPRNAKGMQQKELVRPTRYSRIALTESMATDSVLTLSTVLSVNTELEEKELMLAILLRADRTTRLSARLLRNKKVISCVSFNAESHWTEVRRQFDGSLSLPRHKTAEYRLEVDVIHRGRGYVDIVACSVATSPSIQTIIRGSKSNFNVGKEENALVSNVNYVRNGDFSKWSKGFVFDRIQPRQETADSWRVDCRNESSNAVQLSLFQLRDNGGQENANVKSIFGLNICTQKFEGPMRLVSIIGREFQDAKNMTLKLDVFAPNQVEPIRVIRRIVLLGKSVGNEEVLHVFSRNLMLRFKDTFQFKVSENELVKIRDKSSKHSNIQICIELEQNTNIVISSVQMTENMSEESIDQTVDDACIHKREIDFEDPAITEQAAFLKGLESWRGESDGGQLVYKKTGFVEKISPSAVRRSLDAKHRDDSVIPAVDIVVPIYNALDAVKQCLQSIVKETTSPFTLHCIDDASNLETYKWLKEFCENHSHVHLHTNEENIGYTRTVNRGLEVSTAEWVCVLNSDAIVTSHWLERLAHVARSKERIGIVSPLSNAASYQSVPRIHVDNNKDNGWCFNPLPDNISPNDMAEAVWNSSLSAYPEVGVSNGFCQLISRKMLDEIGTLDESRFPRGFGEENDLCARAIKAGWTIKIADDTYVFHIKSQSFGHDQRVGLSALGKEALLKKHPDVDWKKITTEFQNLAPLVELRHRLIKQGL